MSIRQQISRREKLSETELRGFISDSLADLPLDGKRVLAIIPDSTRSAPLPLFYRSFHENLGSRAERLDYLIALGTHQPMNGEAIDRLLGRNTEDLPQYRVFNHRWNDPRQLREIGFIEKARVEEVTGGLFGEDVVVRINKLIFEYDHLLIVAPTFPHEVVGFSGGNKYFFPGISGPEVLNFFHWLGAVITNKAIIGTAYTPVRKIVDLAASMIDVPRTCFSMVVKGSGVKGIFMGAPEDSYKYAAELSAQEHIRYKQKPFQEVLSIAPAMYEDVWTAGKCMYKLEPVVADGGRLIIYAPHISEVSYTHGHLIDEIGYHVRDYFMKQMDRFTHIPRGVLAHSTHVRGVGTYENGTETPRVDVVLATRIPEERCRRINLGYMAPESVEIERWKNRESNGVLCVEKAGEILYRLQHENNS